MSTHIFWGKALGSVAWIVHTDGVEGRREMEPLQGVYFSATYQLLDYWKPACSVWVDTVAKLCANFRYTDAPWEYLERTNSAILAGSLTASGAPAMPETYVTRNYAETKQAERVDICVATGDP